MSVEVHVVPRGDLVDHVQPGDECPCGPRVEFHEGGTVVIHASLDGRELSEGSESMASRIEVYRQSGSLRRWRWRRVAGNNHITEGPQQGFTTRWSAKRSARVAHPDDPITVTS